MFILKKLITPFLLPPGIFVLFLFTGAIWLVYRQHRKAGTAAIVAGMAMWLMSIAPVADLLRLGLTYRASTGGLLPRGDVIVLLGGGVDDRKIDLSGAPGILSESMADRTVTAARLHRLLKVPIIASGGKPFGGPVSEAEVARRYLQGLGVAGDAILEESSSRDTFENAKEVFRICQRRGFKHPVLVTSDYHLKRARWIFQRVGLNPIPFANGLVSLKGGGYSWEDYLPTSFDETSKYMREYLGLLYYRLVY